MGLQADIQADIAAAFNTDLADAVKPFTGSRETTSGEYDPVTGTYPTIVTKYSGRGVFGGYSIREVDDQHIRRSDVKLTALQSEALMHDEQDAVTSTPATPKVDDDINGYAVINVGSDPACATWAIQLRKT